MQVTHTGKEFKGQPQVKGQQTETVLLVIRDYYTSGPTRFVIVHVLQFVVVDIIVPNIGATDGHKSRVAGIKRQKNMTEI